MRNLLLATVSLMMIQSLSAVAQQAPFKLDDARLVITKDLSSGDTAGENYGKALFARHNFWHQVKKYEAEIRITEIRPDDFTVRESVIPVTFSIRQTGLLLKTEATRGVMGIHDLKGKKIADIFGNYVGGEGGLGVLLNVDEMYIKNSSTGVAINDVQTIWAGLGLAGTKVEVNISPRDTQDTKTTTQAPNSQPQAISANVDELMQKQLQ